MGKTSSLTLGLLLGLTACGAAEDAADDGSITASPSTPTTTIATATTTTEPSATQLPRRSTGSNFLNLTENVEYLHESSGVEMTLQFDRPGWALIHSGERILLLGHATEGQEGGTRGGGTSDAGLGVHFTFLPQQSSDQLTSFFLEHEEVVDATDPQATIVGGLEATTFDVLIGSRDGIPRPTGPFPWTGFALAEEIMADGQPAQNWMVGCAWNRIWIVDLGSVSLVVHAGDASGTPDEVATLAASESAIEELLAAITIGGVDG